MSAEEWGDGISQPKKLFDALHRARESSEKILLQLLLIHSSLVSMIEFERECEFQLQREMGLEQQSSSHRRNFVRQGSDWMDLHQSLNYLRTLSYVIREK